jgi:hypothetical protein
LKETPDYEFIAAQLGVTVIAARIKFNVMRREFAAEMKQHPGGIPTPPSSPSRKRKANCKTESEMSGSEANNWGKRDVKKEPSARTAKAGERIKTEYDSTQEAVKYFRS